MDIIFGVLVCTATITAVVTGAYLVVLALWFMRDMIKDILRSKS